MNKVLHHPPLTLQAEAELKRIWRIRPRGNLWLFAYASLIWRPEGKILETRAGKIHGWHRSLCMNSTVNRGTPDKPGLVFALDRGGSCRGQALRVGAGNAYEEFVQLWLREMPNAVYTPHWVNCATPEGDVVALAFTLSRTHPSYLGKLSDAEYLRRFKSSHGRYGTTWEYVKLTHDALHDIGIADAPLCRLVKLARASGLS